MNFYFGETRLYSNLLNKAVTDKASVWGIICKNKNEDRKQILREMNSCEMKCSLFTVAFFVSRIICNVEVIHAQ